MLIKKKSFAVIFVIIAMLLNLYVFASGYSDINTYSNNNSFIHSSNGEDITIDTSIVDVVTRFGTFAAIDSEGNLFMWGSDNYNKLDIPVGLPPIKKVGIGVYHVVALDVNGILHGWGNPVYGETDFGDALPSFIDMDVDGYNTVAISEDGKVYSWGSANSGEQKDVPTSLGEAVSVDIGPYVRAIINTDGVVESWNGSLPPEMKVKAKQISCVDYEVIALGKDGKVYGNEIYREANYNFITKPNLKHIIQIDRTFAIDKKGKFYAWGTDYCTNSLTSPFDIPENLNALKHISVSQTDAIAIGKDGLIYHWGINANNLALPEFINGFGSSGPKYPENQVINYPNTMIVKTELEFYEAVRAYPQCKNIIVEGIIDIFLDLNINTDVTLTINENSVLNIYGYNFNLDGRLENHGTIGLYGRIVFDGERAEYGTIQSYGGNAAIKMDLINLSDIEKYLTGNTIFTAIYNNSNQTGQFIIDKNIEIPQGFFLAFGTTTLVVNEGVTLTNNGTIWTHIDPIIHGIVEGNDIVTFHF